MSTKKLLANEARKMVTVKNENQEDQHLICLLYTSPSPRD